MFVNIIVVHSNNKGIGKDNSLPWKIPSDLKKFKNLTTGNNNNAIIMGKNTYLSLNKRSLPNRDNLILSNSLTIDNIDDNNNITRTFKNELNLKEFLNDKKYDEIWVIGGENIYDLFLNKTNIFVVKNIYVTLIDDEIECDTFFPAIDYNKYSFMSKSIHSGNNSKYILYDIIYSINQ
tara:strand:- start:161 stop:694 length:534 start_codon:yes stop_codon:yes gene_type:complete